MHNFFTVFTVTSCIIQCGVVNCLPFRQDIREDLESFNDYTLNNNYLEPISSLPEDEDEEAELPRKKRMPWAIGFDVQDNCPIGQVMHPSGNFCTNIIRKEDNYDDSEDLPIKTSPKLVSKMGNRSRKQRMPWSFAGFDVQDNCPVGQVMHPSGKFCTNVVTEDEY